MNPIIIACETIKNELLTVMAEVGCEYPVLWLESGLHNWPDKLRGRIQELMDGCSGYDTVLLAMSFCGNSVVGLRTHDFQLVIPRCDDCITLLLGSQERRQEASATYFLTEGWLKGERNIWVEYQSCMERYGKKRGKRIFDALFAHYHYLALVDTGAYDAAGAEAEARKIAAGLNLEYRRMDGTLEHLRQLLRENWQPERFLRIPPNSTVRYGDCTLKGGAYGL